jgi:hypothetical protein
MENFAPFVIIGLKVDSQTPTQEGLPLLMELKNNSGTQIIALTVTLHLYGSGPPGPADFVFDVSASNPLQSGIIASAQSATREQIDYDTGYSVTIDMMTQNGTRYIYDLMMQISPWQTPGALVSS